LVQAFAAAATLAGLSDTYRLITPCTTTVPSSRLAVTRNGTSLDSQSTGSVSAVHTMSEVAFAVYSNYMPLGIQRLVDEIVASASAPLAASRPLAIAMTWTVLMWLWSLRRLGR
jgi:hypothetical protein